MAAKLWHPVCTYLSISEFVSCVYLYLHLYVPACTRTCMDAYLLPR